MGTAIATLAKWNSLPSRTMRGRSAIRPPKAQCGHIAASQTVSRRCHLVWPLTSWQSVASCDLLRTDPCRNWPGLAESLPWQTYGSGVIVTVTSRRWSSSANRRLLRSGYFPVRQVPSASSGAAPVTSATGVPPQAARRSRPRWSALRWAGVFGPVVPVGRAIASFS